MKTKLRHVNGSYYILLKKEVREMLEIGEEVDIKLENDKIIIQKLKED